MTYFGFQSREDVAQQFETDLRDENILIAVYEEEYYEGAAFVLFYQDDALYEVNGGHCSCYGLEGQWEPEKTTWAAIRHRFDHGQLFPYGVGDDAARGRMRELFDYGLLLDDELDTDCPA